MELLLIGKEDLESETACFSDDDKERSLSIILLGEQESKSSFDGKEDETKDGVLHLFDEEEGFLCILLETSFEPRFRECGRIGRASVQLLI